MGPRLLLLWGVSVVIWWGFAFWPTSPEDSSWLAIAQAACFGSLPGGLPAAQGWMMLTLAPVMLLTGLLLVWGREIAAEGPARLRDPKWRVAVLGLSVVFGLETVWAVSRIETSARLTAVSFAATLSEPLPPAYPRGHTPAPAIMLTDHTGRPFTLATTAGRPVVMSFVFAHCRTVCPAIVTTISSAAERMPPGAFSTVLVTLDPWRDTPSALPHLAAAFGLTDHAHLLSGAPDDVNRVLDGFGVARDRNELTGDVAHVPLVVVLDGEGRIAYQFTNPPVDWIVEGVRRVQSGS
jgi:protein SCO1/2